MSFWLAAALLTFVAALAVLWPWLRAPRSHAGRAEADLAVYRDQLAELDRDVARGVLPVVEADEARAEIGRRVLKSAAEAGQARSPSQPRRLVHLAAVLAVPLISWALYADIGSPGLPAQPLSERLARDPSKNTIEELVARAEAHLAANPDDAAGWEVIGPIYLRVGRYDDAVRAFTRLIALAGATADREAALGEALLAKNGGTVDQESLAAFQRALAIDGKLPKAHFFVALAAAQSGRTDEARAKLTRLVEENESSSPWVGAAQEALQQLDQMAAARDRGPTDEDVAASSAMSDGDRQAMIESMVAQLDARLAENPADADGWKKLVRSYLVLGRADDARAAIARAAKGLDGGQIEELKQLARDAGLTGVE